MSILLFLVSESLGNLGLGLGGVLPFPDSTTTLAVGQDASAGVSLDTRLFVNTTFWQTRFLATSWGLGFGFRYFEFQGPWGQADFYQTPLTLQLRAFNPQERIRFGLWGAGGLCYAWTRWAPPLADTVSAIRPLAWDGETGLSLGFRIVGFLWAEAEAGVWATNGPVSRYLFEPGMEGSRDLVTTGRLLRLNLFLGN